MSKEEGKSHVSGRRHAHDVGENVLGHFGGFVQTQFCVPVEDDPVRPRQCDKRRRATSNMKEKENKKKKKGGNKVSLLQQGTLKVATSNLF